MPRTVTPAPMVRVVGAIVIAVMVALGLVGCTFLENEPDRLSVTDSTGFFHIKIPGTWQYRVEAGLISVYAAEELPSSESFEDPAMLVFLSEMPSEQPLEEMLAALVEERGRVRAWNEGTEIGDAAETTIGDRAAYVAHVSGTDANGIDFESDFYLMRTDARELLLMLVSPADRWEEFSDEASVILSEEWYWHIPDPAVSLDASAAAGATGTP